MGLISIYGHGTFSSSLGIDISRYPLSISFEGSVSELGRKYIHKVF